MEEMLSKDQIRLRATEPDDVDFLVNIENDSELWQYSNTYNPFSRFDLEQYVLLANKDIYTARQVRFMVDLIDEDNYQIIGTVDVFDFDVHNKRAGVGITIIKSERQKGYAGTVLDILISYMFNHIGVHQLFCNIDSENESSKRLFESKGFIMSGIKKDWNFINNKWSDELLYQLINTNNNV